MGVHQGPFHALLILRTVSVGVGALKQKRSELCYVHQDQGLQHPQLDPPSRQPLLPLIFTPVHPVRWASRPSLLPTFTTPFPDPLIRVAIEDNRVPHSVPLFCRLKKDFGCRVWQDPMILIELSEQAPLKGLLYVATIFQKKKPCKHSLM